MVMQTEFNLKKEQELMRGRWAHKNYRTNHGQTTDKAMLAWRKAFPWSDFQLSTEFPLDVEQGLMRERWGTKVYRDKYQKITPEMVTRWLQVFPWASLEFSELDFHESKLGPGIEKVLVYRRR
jgi:hypothetical protein